MSNIIALGGGGFTMEPDNLALDRYLLAQVAHPRPRICFVPTASGDSDNHVARFYAAYTTLACIPTHLSLFRPQAADIEGVLAQADIVFVGGGNTRNMLAVWQAWKLGPMLQRCYQRGCILAGISAGAICWFNQGLTDSVPGALTSIAGLGLLPGTFCPHYDGESKRRPAFHKMLQTGEVGPGFAVDDSAALHFRGGQLLQAVCSRPGAHAYRVELEGGDVREHELPIALVP
ncbi:MAG: Type 1 glutamine amidotransferase-like domain-containing protein [Nannocystaceae bacterium]